MVVLVRHIFVDKQTGKIPPSTGSFFTGLSCDIQALPYGYVHCRCPSLAPANRWKNKIIQPMFGWTGSSTRIPLCSSRVASCRLRRVRLFSTDSLAGGVRRLPEQSIADLNGLAMEA